MLSNTLSNEDEEDVQEELKRLQEEEAVRLLAMLAIFFAYLYAADRFTLHQKQMSICPAFRRRYLCRTRYSVRVIMFFPIEIYSCFVRRGDTCHGACTNCSSRMMILYSPTVTTDISSVSKKYQALLSTKCFIADSGGASLDKTHQD